MSSRARPLILAYNAWVKLVFNASQKMLIQSPAINALLKKEELHLCPVVNFSKSDILSRAEKFDAKLKSVLRKIEADKVDVVAFSMAGLDVRVALQDNKELAGRVENFVTVGTPQRGTLLSRVYANNHLDSSHLEKSNLCTGVHYTDLMETSDEAMDRLNDYFEPHSGTTYHTIAGDKAFQDQSECLRRVSKQLLESKANEQSVFNDGLFFDEEVVGTGHVLKLNADHLDLSPFGINRGQDIYGHVFKYLNSY